MEKQEQAHITSGTVTWSGDGGAFETAVTRILPTEMQVRYYRGGELIGGILFPLSAERRQELFALLDRCVLDWDRTDYTAGGQGPRWQFKICSRGKCLKKIEGGDELPPHGEEIRKILLDTAGADDCWIF